MNKISIDFDIKHLKDERWDLIKRAFKILLQNNSDKFTRVKLELINRKKK